MILKINSTRGHTGSLLVCTTIAKLFNQNLHRKMAFHTGAYYITGRSMCIIFINELLKNGEMNYDYYMEGLTISRT